MQEFHRVKSRRPGRTPPRAQGKHLLREGFHLQYCVFELRRFVHFDLVLFCLQWWNTAVLDRQLRRSRDRLPYILEANRQHAEHVSRIQQRHSPFVKAYFPSTYARSQVPYITAERIVSKVQQLCCVAATFAPL